MEEDEEEEEKPPPAPAPVHTKGKTKINLKPKKVSSPQAPQPRAQAPPQPKASSTDAIVDMWDMPSLPYVFYDSNPKLYTNIGFLIERLNSSETPVYDTMLMSMTTPYNDKILTYYGNNAKAIEILFEGLKRIAMACGANDYVETLKETLQPVLLKKGYVSEPHRELIQVYFLYKQKQSGKEMQSHELNLMEKFNKKLFGSGRRRR